MHPDNLSKKDAMSLFIGILRFPLSVLIVTIHCFINVDGFVYGNVQQPLNTVIFCWLESLLRSGFAQVAVPIFFLMSGYLFFSKLEFWNWEIWIHKIINRTKSILKPYLLFLIFSITMSYVANYISFNIGFEEWVDNNGGLFHLFWDCIKWNTSNYDIWGRISESTAPFLLPLWYLRDLMVIFILTPVIYVIFKIGGGKTLIILLSFLVMTSTASLFNGFSFIGLFYFSLGAYMRYFNYYPSVSSLISNLLIICYLSLLIGECISGGALSLGCISLAPVFQLVSVIVIYNILYNRIIKTNCLLDYVTSLSLKLSKYSYWIYLSHIFIISFIQKFYIKFNSCIFYVDNIDCEFVNEHLLYMMISYLLIIALVVVTSVASYSVMDRYCPKILRFLIGK